MTVSYDHRHTPPLQPLATALAVGLFVSACAARSPAVPDNPVTSIPEQGNWFCQMEPSGNGWECVQDPHLAENPEPQRIPQPTPPPEPMSAPDSLPPPTAAPGLDHPPRLDDDAGPPGREEAEDELPDEHGPAGEDAPEAATAPYPVAPEGAPDPPDYVRLAYRPPRPTALTDLRGDLYAVQLIAMSSKRALESFVDRESISGMSAARVERDGELYFVLLLGIYETVALARRAIASLPAEMAGIRPWIRPLGSLQAAMLRANELTGSSRY